MPIKYAVSNPNTIFIRPTGYTFPAGLSFIPGTGGPTSIEYLVIAGGGSGYNGGGGAGGLRTGTGVSINIAQSYVITVGAGAQFWAKNSGSNSSISGTGFTTITNTFNGSTWSPVSSMNTARGNLIGAGTQTATLAFGGFNPGLVAVNNTESWNGTSWTAVNTLNTSRGGLGGAGTQTTALAFGGANTPPGTNGVSSTELWNGTSWSSAPPMATARAYLAGCGTQTAGLAAGGYNFTATLTSTEEWTGTPTTATASTLTTS
jgi:hypothetical protein